MTLDSLGEDDNSKNNKRNSKGLQLPNQGAISSLVHGLLFQQENTKHDANKKVRSLLSNNLGFQLDGFIDVDNTNFLSIGKVKLLFSYLRERQGGMLTEGQSNYLLKYCNGLQMNTESIIKLIKSSVTTDVNLEPCSPYIFLTKIQNGNQKTEDTVGAISLKQIKGEEYIMLNGKFYYSITYYKNLYPNLDTYYIMNFFKNSLKKLSIIDEIGTSIGYLYLMSENLIISDNPDIYFDITQYNKTKIKNRYYTLNGFNSIYGHEYDIRKIISFSHPKSLIIKLSNTGSLYNKEEIDRVIESRKGLIEINSIENAGVDLCDKPKALINGKLYLRAIWKNFTDNPYFIAFANKNVSDFTTVKRIFIKEKLIPLEKRKGELGSQITSLNNDLGNIRKELDRKTKKESERKSATIEYNEYSKYNSYTLDQLNDLYTTQLKKLYTLNSEFVLINNEMLKYTKGIMTIDEPGFLIIDGELFVEEQMLINAMKDFSDPLTENSFGAEAYSGSKIYNGTIYVQNPSKIFVGVQIEWNKFLKKIPQQTIAEGDAPSYLYETIVNELLKGGFVYKNSVNRGIIALHQRYWINIDSNVALEDLSSQVHRGIGSIKTTLKELRQQELLGDMGKIQLFNLDTGNMQTLYDKNEFSKLLLSKMNIHN